MQEMHPNYTNISTTHLSVPKSSQGQSQTDKDGDGDIDVSREVEAVKEKEPPTVPTSRGSISKNTSMQSTHVPPKPTTEEAQAQYMAAQQQLEIVKENIEYDYIEEDYYRESVDSLLASMEEVFLSKESTVKIGKVDMPRQAVISTYLKLTKDHIDHVLDRFKTVRNPITHVHAYLKTCLYRAYQELDPHMRNLVTQHYGY